MPIRVLLFLLLLAAFPALAQQAAPAADCQTAVSAAERAARLPARLLTTISLVESGRPDPVSGRVVAWPWAINAGGASFFYDTKAEAIAAARAFHKSGVASIDVGCMQISLLFHPNAFATLDDAFDPPTNAAYGARFLSELHDQTGDWLAAAAAYHSQTPELGAEYQQKVMALWPMPAKMPLSPGARVGSLALEDSRNTPTMRAMLRQSQLDQKRLAALYNNTATPAFRDLVRQHREDQRRMMAAYGPRGSLGRPTGQSFDLAHVPPRQIVAAPLWAAAGP